MSEPLTICLHRFVIDKRHSDQIICENCWEIRNAATGWTLKKGILRHERR